MNNTRFECAASCSLPFTGINERFSNEILSLIVSPSMEPRWTEERVRALFRQLQQSHPRVQRWPGPALGLELRRMDPTFHKNVLGDPSLKRLVLRLGDMGRWIDEGVGVFEWNEPRGSVVLHRDFWLAASRAPTEPDQWFDLDALKIERDRAHVAECPERYLLIPALDDESIRAIAALIGDERTATQLREAALSRSDTSPSARHFQTQLSARVAQWATDHGIGLRTIGRLTVESREPSATDTARSTRHDVAHPLVELVAELLPEEARALVQQLAARVDGDARPLLLAMLTHVAPSKIDTLSIPARLLRASR
ncbi:MAG: hypothetical protein U0269_11415 [Polyangiales bacterium]